MSKSTYEKELILEVLAERSLPIGFKLDEICFPEQLAFIRDTGDWVSACCSRRSGKTEICALDLLNTALNHPNSVNIYVTTTRANAERIVWAKLLLLNDKYELKGKPNNSKLSITFGNGSRIYLTGCKDKASLDNFRGMALKLVYIDEVQSFRPFLKDLVDDVLGPALADYRGKLKLIGTPAALKNGFFYETLQSNEWTHHKWTFWNNPFIAKTSKLTHQQILDRELKRRGVDVNNPSVRREWFGEWTNDSNSLVLHWSDHNHYKTVPTLTDYVIGVDLGSNREGRDKDAIAVIGWNAHDKECYLVEEQLGKKTGFTPLMEQIEAAIIKYKPLKVVMDSGGLGAKIADELRKRYQLPIVAAEKVRKLEFLALLDDALRSNRFKSHRHSMFTQDSFLMEWDYDLSTADKFVVKKDPHSDIIDAVLYAYREALHWLSEPLKAPVNVKDPKQWLAHTQKLMNDQLERQIQLQKAEENEADYFASMTFDDPRDITQYFLNKRKR